MNIKFKRIAVMVTLGLMMGTASAEDTQIQPKLPAGDVHQKLCVKLLEPAYQTLKVNMDQWTEDTRSRARTSEEITIPQGSEAETYCGQNQLNGSIRGKGKVHFDFRVYDTQRDEIAQFTSYSAFDGSGWNNDWDIREKEQCAYNLSEPGVNLTVNGDTHCGNHADVPDSKVAKVTFVPDFEHPDHGYPHYDAREVEAGNQVWGIDDIAYSEHDQKLYRCLIGNWCSSSPQYYEPGLGLNWDQAWDVFQPE